MDPPSHHSGLVNGDSRSARNNGHRREQPFSVEEALPYSPLSQIVPFNPTLIPLPNLGFNSSASLFSNATDRDVGKKALESLNSDAAPGSETSHRLEQTLQDLQQLLKPETLTNFQFKMAPAAHQTDLHQAQIKPPTLSPFSQMLYDRMDLPIRYSTPAEKGPQAAPTNGTSTSSMVKKSPARPLPKPMPKPKSLVKPGAQRKDLNHVGANDARNAMGSKLMANGTNGTISGGVDLPMSIDPSMLSLQLKEPLGGAHSPRTLQELSKDLSAEISLDLPADLDLTIELPPDLPTDVPNELPETLLKEHGTEAPKEAPKKRKRTEFEDEEDFLARGGDPQERADSALRALQDYLQNLFDAEDQFQPGLPLTKAASSHLSIVGDKDINLTNNTLSHVDKSFQKVILYGRFQHFQVDDLLRVQKLCDSSLKAAESVDLKIDEGWAEADVELWLQRVNIAVNGIMSARVALRLMSGSREEKQLYSEETIQSAINAFKNSVDACLIPVTELRPTGSSSHLFKLLTAQKKSINVLLSQASRLLVLLAKLVSCIELSESVVTSLQFAASQLIFVENAHAERESVLGTQKYDSLRFVAMDTLAQIFLHYPGERPSIFDEILTSLEKLPVTRQSARQFKLAEGGNIQLVSALIMRLVQTTANKSDDAKDHQKDKVMQAIEDKAEGVDSIPSVLDDALHPGTALESERHAVQQHSLAMQELQTTVQPLLDGPNGAKSSAAFVVSFILSRAMKSTKSGDAPYRNLLDLFVEDFVTCLDSPDWPAAELLLRFFLFKMVALAENDKSVVSEKNLALDLLGVMGAAISELGSHVRKTTTALDYTDNDRERHITQLAETSLSEKLPTEGLLSWDGPYRAVLEELDQRGATDAQLRSASGFLMADWASQICSAYEELEKEEDPHKFVPLQEEYGRLAYRLRMMICDRRWLATESTFNATSQSQARLAYSVALLNSQFCTAFQRVLAILLRSMSSDQATVRSKSLRSVNQLLETDPSILDRDIGVMELIRRCSTDLSSQVRDSALGLIGKCIGLKPALEEKLVGDILRRFSDSGVGVRKRAVRLSRDIYLRNTNRDVRSAIADGLLHRVVLDLDESMQELACQTIEEVWMLPFQQSSSGDASSVQYKLGLQDQVALMVKTVQSSGGASAVLDRVLEHMLSSKSRYAAGNLKVCENLVATMFETVIDNPSDDDRDAPSVKDVLQILTTFAKAAPKLFSPTQIQLLQPYIANIADTDDLSLYRSVTVIYRHVFPHLPNINSSFLIETRKLLMTAVSRLSRLLLDDVIACLWIISEALNSHEHLARLTVSTLAQISKLRGQNFAGPKKEDLQRRLFKLLLIAGMCGKHSDLDSQAQTFRNSFPKWGGQSVSELMVDTFAPYASPSQPQDVRKAALDAIGMVCQSWPKNFQSVKIYTVFQEAFNEQARPLESVIMRSIRDFFIIEEKRSEKGASGTVANAHDGVATLGVMGGSQHDGVAIDLTQRFVQHITRIALATQDDHALLATEILGSINRQGAVHPKEYAPALVALETSQNHAIAELAFSEHRMLHNKRETILEKEYMKAVVVAFEYQRDIAKDTRGATVNPFNAKLYMLMEVFKSSKPKARKKFLENLCARLDFEPNKLETHEDPPPHLILSQFIIENLAFFDYASVDELLTAIAAMEKVVSGTGTSLAHTIESEVFQTDLKPSAQSEGFNNELLLQAEDNVTPRRLRHLTACTIVFSCLWEARTHLRRTYGLMSNKKDSKGKHVSAKDLNKAPSKVAGVAPNKFWEDMEKIMGSLSDTTAMTTQCRNFVDLLTIDKDFKLAAEDDDDAGMGRASTPSGDEAEMAHTPGGRAQKRKGAGTPSSKKKRQRSTSRSRGSNPIPKGAEMDGQIMMTDDVFQ